MPPKLPKQHAPWEPRVFCLHGGLVPVEVRCRCYALPPPPELELWCGYEELNSGPLQEQVFLNT